MNNKIDQLSEVLVSTINSKLLGKKTDSYDILSFANLYATFDTARYYCEHMNKATNCSNDLELIKNALQMRKFEGQILEFGVASGRTINYISSLVDQMIYGFDVFTGLPETWRTGFSAGSFGRQSLPQVNNNVELIVGLFEDTLDNFINSNNTPISFLHIDCDLYSGTKTILNKLAQQITSGTIIVFDEYFNYPGWRQHEFLAFQEFVKDNNIKYKYVYFASNHQQVCVVFE